LVHLIGCSPFEKLTKVVEEYPRAAVCGECHPEIHREWSGSRHAHAYANAPFRNATNDYRFGLCLGCHAPEPRLTPGRPAARSAQPEEGVTCVSCHLEEGKLTGPLKSSGLVAPHAVNVTEARYKDSRFCGRCHEGTYAEWNATTMDKKPTCQECHMPRVKRKVTQATGLLSRPLVALEREEWLKRHLFITNPQELDRPPFSVEAKRDGETVTVTIKNHVPHLVPTGDFGLRVAVLEAFAVDAKGEAVKIGERELLKEVGTAIQPQASLEWKLSVPADTKSLQVKLTRLAREGVPAAELIKTELPLR